jgi:hypothetical protein
MWHILYPALRGKNWIDEMKTNEWMQYARKSNLSPDIRLCPVKLVMKFQTFMELEDFATRFTSVFQRILQIGVYTFEVQKCQDITMVRQ